MAATSSMTYSCADALVAPLTCTAALTHHWLVRIRGGEKVLAALAELLPGSPVYVLVHDPAVGVDAPPLDGTPGRPAVPRAVHASFLQRLPWALRHYPKLLPLMPLAARRVRLPPVDLVVCSDAAIAKAMTPDARSRVVCYCHSPMRYVWEPTISEQYRRALPASLRPLWGALAAYVRGADFRAAQRVDQFVANSQHVARRIRRHYGRGAIVVHPPVDLPGAPAAGRREDFYLCVGYHVPYKRLDLAVEACRRLGRHLVVIGDGPDVERLRGTGDSHVRWLGWQGPEVINAHYRRAAAVLFPGEEDFGIVPVEAMAHGCPVIGYGVGGVTESVIEGQTGVLFTEQTVDHLAAAIRQAGGMKFDPYAMHAQMQRFSRVRFLREMRDVLTGVLHGSHPSTSP